MSTARINELVTAIRDRWLWVFGYIPQVDSLSSGDGGTVEVEGWIAKLVDEGRFVVLRKRTGACWDEGRVPIGWIAESVIRCRVSEKLAAFKPAEQPAPASNPGN